MNTKNNQRARETDERIIRAVYRAITEERRPLNRITVREICAEAEINRSTFYAHYQDVYDVVEKTERAMSERLTRSALEAAKESSSITGIFERVFEFIGEYREFYRVYFGEMHRAGIIGVAWDLLNDKTKDLDFAQLGFRSQAELEYIGTYFIYGLSAMLRRWIEAGCRETPRELVEFLLRHYAPDRSLLSWGEKQERDKDG